MTLEDFLSQHIMKQKCSSLPNTDAQNDKTWNSFVQTIHYDYPLIKVVVYDLDVTIYSLTNTVETSCVIERISLFIKEKYSMPNFDTDSFRISSDSSDDGSLKYCNAQSPSDHNDIMNVQTIKKKAEENDFDCKTATKISQETYYFELTPHEYKYMNVALKSNLAVIQQACQEQCSEIELVNERIKITCHPDYKDTIFVHLKDYFINIIHRVKYVEYPGVLRFIESLEGQTIIEQLSQTFVCAIEIPSKKHQPRIFKDSDPDSIRPCYNVVVLHTARLGNLNIHLVQGKIENINLKMKVMFKPVTKGKILL